MRKLIITLAGTFTFTLLTFSTFAQMLQISSMNGNEICQGFASDNQAIVQVVSGLPMSAPVGTYVTYTWTSTHANGTRVWDSNRGDRRIPIPWAGEYTVQVQIQYIREGKRRPYAVFWSNKITVIGTICKP